jgi:RNA polymerase sigma-70 factor (ECF subfamily)
VNLSSEEQKEQTRDLTAALAADLDGAFEALVRAYQQRIYAFALRLAGNAADAEEIAQDAFVRAYRALARYPAERICALALRPWLYQIALNVARNRLRDHARERRAAVVSLDERAADGQTLRFEPADDPSGRPEEAAEAGEQRRDLAERLAALPASYRAAVVLRHVEGFSYAEMAEQLGQPIGTVKANVHRGARLLRAALVAVVEGA